MTPHANPLAVHCFEAVAVGLWLLGWAWIRRHPRAVYVGAYIGSSTLAVFDWTFNAKWFFNVTYDKAFLPLWRIDGQIQPIALCMTYAFYFGGPLLVAIEYRDAIDRRLGRVAWPVVFAVSGLVNPLFEIPLVHWLHLWTYHQRSVFLLGGVAWSNIWYSGLLFTTCYGAVRLVLRWMPWEHAGGSVAAFGSEEWWRSAALGAAAIWVAFYLSMQVQLVWYAIAQPWAASPRPF